MTAVEVTPIDNLAATQANQQTFTAEGSGGTTPECVTVTNFGSIKSDADSANEGNVALGGFIWGHPFANNFGWWSVISQGSCADQTWVAGTGYILRDGTQLW